LELFGRNLSVNNPVLIFHTEATNDNSIWGRLELIEVGEWPLVPCRDRFLAASGLPGYQDWEAQNIKGAGILPRADLAKIPCYYVDTNPVHLPGVPGVEGNFYPITPFIVANGRGDFGIHYDANVEGSAGCVVIKNHDAWDAFQTRMADYKSQGISKIPLQVFYS
jgi:hypothetical protein